MNTAPAIDYDRTEGLGGVSVSSYDSMEEDRVPVDPSLRNYPPTYHHGKRVFFSLIFSLRWQLGGRFIRRMDVDPGSSIAILF